MVIADTKDVKATERITYETVKTVGDQVTEHTKQTLTFYLQEKERTDRKEKDIQKVQESQRTKRIYELSEEDYEALVRLVEAEASGEDVKGKMLVANVVLNRVADSAFPDSVEEVVYQQKGGKAQFSPVASGKIHQVTVSAETKEAVERVLCGEDESKGALYFVARAYADPKNMQWFDNHLTWLFIYDGHEFYA